MSAYRDKSVCYFRISILTLIFVAAPGCDSASSPVRVSEVDQADVHNLTNDKLLKDEWQMSRDLRVVALEAELGEADETIATSPLPIYLGGGADVLTFKKHVDGVAYVTTGLIGDDSQQKTPLGQYELMMCFRSANDWAPSLLSRLAPYTYEVALNPGETMDIGPEMPENSTIAALLFVSYRQFKVNDTSAGILLGIGITKSELAQCQAHGSGMVLAALKDADVFPFTDPEREAVLE